jgi:hypothetical protein
MSPPRFPDVQRRLVNALEAWIGAGHVGVETPPSFDGLLPFVRVVRVGGPSDRLNDQAAVDIDVFGESYLATEQLAEEIRQWLCGPPPAIAVFDRVGCDTGPRELPWGDGLVRRWGASYSITARRTQVA